MKSLNLTKPHAIVMVGIPGSGKTFFARKFSEIFNTPLVSIDDIQAYAKDNEAAYDIANLQLTELLKTKQSILIEVDSATRASRRDLTQYLKKSGYIPRFVWVQTDPETAKQRALKQKGADAKRIESQFRRFSPPHSSENPTVISGRHTFASQAKTVLKHLSNQRPDGVVVVQRKPLPSPNRSNVVSR